MQSAALQVFFIPRPGKIPPAESGAPRTHVVPAPPFFTFHHINAYERDGGSRVVLDTISWQHIAFDITQHTVTKVGWWMAGLRRVHVFWWGGVGWGQWGRTVVVCKVSDE
jgi:carotenoid cleavage dioxygenase-like enzyme